MNFEQDEGVREPQSETGPFEYLSLPHLHIHQWSFVNAAPVPVCVTLRITAPLLTDTPNS